ncbi:MAG: phosphohydrolase [Pseudomonas sp.]|nr:phosphohydrolase [Pseudomonas sp.]
MNACNTFEPLSALKMPEELRAQLDFIRQIDALKSVWRQTVLVDGSRTENDAEHSWEMALMAVVLKQYAPVGADMLRVIKMLLIHDLVEIDAGDAYAYDVAANVGQKEREQAAAIRIFGLLPHHQGEELKALWEEFEARTTPDARFARAMDRLQPLLHSYQIEGRTWQARGITASAVRRQMTLIGEASPELGQLAEAIIEDAAKRGWVAPE